MILYLTARANITDLFVDSIKVRLASGKEVRLTWDESDIKRTDFGFHARYKGVYFDEEYANGRIKELHGMQILDVALSSENKGCNLFFIEQLEFEDNGEKVSFKFPIVLADVCDVRENISEAEFDYVAIYFFAIIIVEEVSDRIRINRFEAFQKLRAYLHHYRERGFPLVLVFGILKRKGQMILCSSTKEEMKRIVKPAKPHFDGSKFVLDEYSVLEEELISWSETSLYAPLNYTGIKRYQELMKMIFPEKYKEVEEQMKT